MTVRTQFEFNDSAGTALASAVAVVGSVSNIVPQIIGSTASTDGAGFLKLDQSVASGVSFDFVDLGTSDVNILVSVQTGAVGVSAQYFQQFRLLSGAFYSLTVNEGTKGIAVERYAAGALAATLITDATGYTGGTLYEFRVTMVGSAIRLFRDGVLIGTASDGTLTTGFAGGTLFSNGVLPGNQTMVNRVVVEDDLNDIYASTETDLVAPWMASQLALAQQWLADWSAPLSDDAVVLEQAGDTSESPWDAVSALAQLVLAQLALDDSEPLSDDAVAVPDQQGDTSESPWDAVSALAQLVLAQLALDDSEPLSDDALLDDPQSDTSESPWDAVWSAAQWVAAQLAVDASAPLPDATTLTVNTSGAVVFFGAATTSVLVKVVSASGAVLFVGSSTVSSPRNVSASGAVKFTGAATASSPRNVSVSGAVKFTGAGNFNVGTVPRNVTASGAVVFTGSGALAARVQLAASGAVKFTGVGTLNALAKIAASGAVVFTGSATASSPRNASASGAVKFTGSGTFGATSPRSVAIVGVVVFTGTATAAVRNRISSISGIVRFVSNQTLADEAAGGGTVFARRRKRWPR